MNKKALSFLKVLTVAFPHWSAGSIGVVLKGLHAKRSGFRDECDHRRLSCGT